MTKLLTNCSPINIHNFCILHESELIICWIPRDNNATAVKLTKYDQMVRDQLIIQKGGEYLKSGISPIALLGLPNFKGSVMTIQIGSTQ